MTPSINTTLASQATAIADELLRAYLETDYIVHTEPVIILSIGQPCAQMIQLHKQHGVECSAFMTAFNPYSQPCTIEVNLYRQQQLIDELRKRSLKFVNGVGQHPVNEWPGEPSLLILGLSLEAAKTLGTRFEQHALVWIGPNGIPELALLS